MNKRVSMHTSTGVLSLLLLLSLPSCERPKWLPEWIPCCGSKDTCGIMTEVQSAGEPVAGTVEQGVWVSPDDKTEVLAFMDGKPLVTRGEVEALFEADEQFKTVKPYLKKEQLEQYEAQVLKGLISKKLVRKLIREKGIDQQADYLTRLNALNDQVRVFLDLEAFKKMLNVAVPDSEIKEFYDANKDKIPQALVSRGGVRAACVQFDNEADARLFEAKVKELGDIKQAVEQAGLVGKFKDFMLVNDQSHLYEPVLREKILAMEVPGTELCAVGDNAYYVVSAAGKEEPVYQSYDKIKKQLKDWLENQKREQMAQQELEKLADTYQVTKSKAGNALLERAEQSALAMQQELMSSEGIE